MLRDWLRLCRAEHGIIVFLAVIIAEWVASGRFDGQTVFAAIGPMLITWGAFAWGDYFGLKSDKALNRKNLPLVSGAIAPKHALGLGMALMLFGAALTFPVGAVSFAIALGYTALSMAYDPILKKRPLIGNAFIASSMSISFLYGNLAVQPDVVPAVALFSGIAFLAGLGRELIITLRDVAGDRKIGANTLPMLLGPRKTVVLATVLTYAAVALSLVPLLRPVNPLYIPLAVATDALFLLGTYYVLLSQKTEHLNRARKLTLYGMLFGVLALAALGL